MFVASPFWWMHDSHFKSFINLRFMQGSYLTSCCSSLILFPRQTNTQSGKQALIIESFKGNYTEHFCHLVSPFIPSTSSDLSWKGSTKTPFFSHTPQLLYWLRGEDRGTHIPNSEMLPVSSFPYIPRFCDTSLTYLGNPKQLASMSNTNLTFPACRLFPDHLHQTLVLKRKPFFQALLPG